VIACNDCAACAGLPNIDCGLHLKFASEVWIRSLRRYVAHCKIKMRWN
jgi:hypothetical protein